MRQLILSDFTPRQVDIDYSPLLDIAGRPVRNFVTDGDVTIIGRDDRPLFQIYRNETGYMVLPDRYAGFIGCGELNITIKSRFSSHDGKSDPFLIYMLARVLNFDMSTLLHGAGDSELTDLLHFLFPDMLDRAISRGIYKEYHRESHNDMNLRGTVETSRHIAQNIPFNGRIAYSTREHSSDNAVTQLIRHTVEAIESRPLGHAILQRSPVTRDNVTTIRAITPSYTRTSRNRVIAACLNMRPHPFYSDYEPLCRLCIRILRNELIDYDSNTSERIHGTLVDMSWLWEQYLATLLATQGFTHPDNRLGTDRIYLDRESRLPRFPDYYAEDMVIDAKYKRDASGREDIAQVISYMHCLPASRGILVEPVKNGEKPEDKSYTLLGNGGRLEIFGFPIPKADSLESFIKLVRPSETSFLNFTNK